MDGEGVSRVLAALIAKCPEWAAGVMATAVTIWAGVQSVRGIIASMKGLTGPTNQQVDVGIRKAVDESISGQLKELAGQLGRLDERLDQTREELGELRGALGVRRGR